MSPSNRVGRQRHAYIKESTNVRTKDLHGEIEGSASRLKPGESIIFFQSTRKQTLGSLSWSRNLEQLWPTFRMFALLHPSSIRQKKREIRRHHNWEAEGGNANGSSQEQQSLLEFYSQNPPLTTASNWTLDSIQALQVSSSIDSIYI